jgi:hypothetical protein
MKSTMFLAYDKKDKTKFVLLKLAIFISIILMGILAFEGAKLELPSLSEKLSFGVGVIAIVTVVIIAFLNRLKSLFKFKSASFVLIAVILYGLRTVIEPLSFAFLLISIPLLIDDLIIDNYFKYLNVKKYFDVYKFIGAHHE